MDEPARILQRLVRELGVLAYLPPEHVALDTAFDVEIFGSWVGGESRRNRCSIPRGERTGLEGLPLGRTDPGIAA